jgi:hypothetical protein
MHERREVAVAKVAHAQPVEVTASQITVLASVNVNISTTEGDRTVARVYGVTLVADGGEG